jgi:hypothetical protein
LAAERNDFVRPSPVVIQLGLRSGNRGGKRIDSFQLIYTFADGLGEAFPGTLTLGTNGELMD